MVWHVRTGHTSGGEGVKYSIIIVAYKAFEYLEKCIASIKASSIQDYEIVLVDNNPDATDDMAKLPYNRFHWDGKNHGFAEGCNIGAELAKGEILILLNPDTEVYGDWADRMAKALDASYVGAVGPVSDFVAGTQRLDFHFPRQDTPAATAAWAAEHMVNQTMDTKLLIGMCLMIRRTLWTEIGGMDPALFLGNDDLDLSWRLRQAGYCLLIARDVFIHHVGHKSFETRPRPEVMALLEESEVALHNKLLDYYNGEPPSAMDLWGVDFFYTGPYRRMTLSVVMIVREEAENLHQLIPQLDFADQIVVVDTSLPGEEQIVRARRAEVHYRPWDDDFAAARNFAKSKATGDWILWLDADDRVPEETARLIRGGLDKPSRRMMQRRVYFDLKIVNTGVDGQPYGETFFQPRILPNIPEVQWSGKIHESPMPSIIEIRKYRLLERAAAVDMVINHTGYATAEQRQAKTDRNLRMLRAQPDTPQKYMDMANAFAAIEQWTEAGALWSMIFDRWGKHLELPFADHISYQVGVSLYRAKAFGEALPWFWDSNKQDALYMRGDTLLKLGKDGRAHLREYLAQTPEASPWGSHRHVMVAEAKRLLGSPLG